MHDAGQIHHAAGIAHFIVIPGIDFRHGAIRHQRGWRIDDGTPRIPCVIGGNQRPILIAQNAGQRAGGGGSLEGALTCVEWLLSPESDGIGGRLISAPWDPWRTLASRRDELAPTDIYTLRRIVPEDRGAKS